MERNQYGSDVNLHELCGQLAARLTVLPVAGALVLGIWLSGRRANVPFTVYTLQMMLLGSAAGVWVLVRTRPVLARHILMWSMIGELLIALWVFDGRDLPLLGTVVVFASGLVVSGGEFVAAAIVAGASMWLVRAEGRFYQMTHVVFGMSAAAGVVALTKSTLYTALDWAWTMEERADTLLEEARQRQGQLANALKSVDTSNHILRRTKRELIAARQEAEQARSLKEQFAANVSHELRTPLSLILGFSEIMSLSPEVYGDVTWPSSLRRDINQIYRSSRHLLEMIDDVLDLSRFEFSVFALNKEPTLLGPLLEETIQIARDLFRGEQVCLETDISEDLPVLEIDGTRIRQALLNLLTNAARYTEEGFVRVKAGTQCGEVVFTVQDTGPGIPADKRANIFEEFYQVDGSMRRSHGGFGLGLAISKRFVEAHHGRIWVESEPNRGSSFSFALPVPNSIVPISHLEWEEGLSLPKLHTSPTVLLVEQDSAVLDMVSRHLDHYQVIQVEQPGELPEAVALHHPHAVIRNIAPGDGSPVIHENEPDLDIPIPLIDCSLPSNAWLAQHLQIKDCLRKPITRAELVREVASLETVCDILVVDDDPAFCRLVERMLTSTSSTLNCTIRCAYGGRDGLRELHRLRPDLLFLDLVMPDTDGFQVMEEIRMDPKLRDIPIVLLTATTIGEDVLAQRGNRFVIRKGNGLQPMEVLRYLKAVLEVVRPRYDERHAPEAGHTPS